MLIILALYSLTQLSIAGRYCYMADAYLLLSTVICTYFGGHWYGRVWSGRDVIYWFL